ncbi:hypothetical protein LPW28_14910, partial [Ectothiorhodospira sp. 9905]|nr:hypothetical protein [Ectothiorhodospira sp. 9905]
WLSLACWRCHMYAVEFETDIKSEFIRIPQFEKLKNRHVKVIVLMEDPPENAQAGKAQTSSPRRRPAKVPPIIFKGDVIDTVPDSSWNLN